MNKEIGKRALTAMKAVNNRKDPDSEEDHMLADIILCELLEGLGYKEIVLEYSKLEKGYE